MSSKVWPRAPRSGANETSNVGVDIKDSISGAREVDHDDNDDDDGDDDTINNGGGTATPER